MEGTPGSGLWRGVLHCGGQNFRLEGSTLSLQLVELRLAARGRAMLPGLDPDAGLNPYWMGLLLSSEVHPIPDDVLHFVLAYEAHLERIKVSEAAYFHPRVEAQRTWAFLTRGGKLDVETLAATRDPSLRRLALYVQRAAAKPPEPAAPTEPLQSVPSALKPPPFEQPVSQNVGKFAPPRPNSAIQKQRSVLGAPSLPSPIVDPALRFGRLRAELDQFVEYAVERTSEQLTRAQLVALAEAICKGAEPDVLVTQQELSQREKAMAVAAEELVGAIPSGPFDLLALVWGHLRLWLSDQDVDCPPWPTRTLPDTISEDRDLALCLWTTFGPRATTYELLSGLNRGAFARTTRSGTVRVARGRTTLLSLRGSLAVRALDRLLQWSGDSDVRVYPKRPFLPVRPGSTDAMTANAIKRLLRTHGFPITNEDAP